MRITSLELERHDLVLSEPYVIAYETIERSTNYILRLVTDRGIIGLGCAAPDPVVTGESPAAVENAFRSTIEPLLLGADPHRYAALVHELREDIGVGSSALAMVDGALYDLVSRAAGIPLYRFLGAYRSSIPTSVTIGILPYDEMLAKARHWIDEGFGILKIKGGLDWEEDHRKLRTLRERYPTVKLRFDGNQGYSYSDALCFAQRSRRSGLRLELIEQPLSVEAEMESARLSRGITQPVMADESMKTLRDALQLAADDSVDMINIKVQKVGGIQEAMHVNSVAKSAAYEVMVGCLDECSVGIAGGLHFALSRPNVKFADLDSFLDYPDDPFSGLFRLEKGVLFPKDTPGIG